jgi:hypothetical protein
MFWDSLEQVQEDKTFQLACVETSYFFFKNYNP